MAPHAFTPTSAPALTRRYLLQGLAAVAATSALSGCGAALVHPLAASTSGEPTPPTPQPLPSGAITSASLTVAATTIGSIDAGFLGLAYEKQSLQTPLFTSANTNLIALFRRLGPGVLRIGGPSVDHNVWATDGISQTPGEITPAAVDALASFLRATGWSCLYAINLGGSATGATTPALAAAEAAYVTAQLGPALLAIELGNACESYGATFYAGKWSVEIFETLWQQYRSAILAVTPSVRFSGPAAAGNLDSWTIPFAEYVTSGQLGMLSQQITRGPASSAAIADLLAPDPALASEMLTLHYAAQSIGVPFRIDGFSSYDDGGATGISNAYASTLWAVDSFFQAALAGASGLNFISGGQQPDALLPDVNGQLLAPQPAFYGLLLASMAGTGNLLATELAAGSLNVTAYAIQTATGGMNLVLVNKESTKNLDAHIELPQPISSATLQQLTQHSDGAAAPNAAALTGVTLQGAAIGHDGTFEPGTAYSLAVSGTQLSCYVPAVSAVLIQIT